MKRSIPFVLAALFTSLPSHAARWGGSGGGMRGGSVGARAGGHVSAAPSLRGSSFAGSSAVTRGISARQGSEVVPNHYYFHNEGGSRYWHYFDRGGLHWYGFYFGPDFFWFPFYAGYWWWYDANLTRWAYWWDGYWWWNGPGGALYVDVDGDYVPYDQYKGQAPADASANAPAPPSSPPTATPNAAPANAPAKEGSALSSPDGKRMVQIVGSDGGAFLFDESSKPPRFMKYLGANAEKVRFSGGSSGRPLQILVEFKDGSFTTLDAEGKPIGNSASPPAGPAPAR